MRGVASSVATVESMSAPVARPAPVPLPSTRDLAAQLGVSRPVVVDAYSQLAAEGYLALRQGARPRVSAAAPTAAARPVVGAHEERRIRFDFLPAVPDLSSFPRATWL